LKIYAELSKPKKLNKFQEKGVVKMKKKMIAAIGILVIAAASFAFAMRDTTPDKMDCPHAENCCTDSGSCCGGK